MFVNLVDLVKSFPASISLKILASIQKRTRPIKFDHLAEKSDKGSISNLSTKNAAAARPAVATTVAMRDFAGARGQETKVSHVRASGFPSSRSQRQP